MIQGLNEAKVSARGRHIDIAAGLIWFGLERKAVSVALVN